MIETTDFTIEVIPFKNYKDYSLLSAHVHSLMEHPEHYVSCTGSCFEELTEENSILIGIYQDHRLIAGFLALAPSEEENYANYLEEPFDLDTVIHMETVAVHEDYRGYHLQKRLLLCAEPFILSKFPRKVNALCTVHPDNIPSSRNVELAGYKKIAYVPDIYGGSQRNIYYKKLIPSR
ncbi:MAG: hypothetical protein ACI39H_01710 [Lachnospiraceae bacterium]